LTYLQKLAELRTTQLCGILVVDELLFFTIICLLKKYKIFTHIGAKKDILEILKYIEMQITDFTQGQEYKGILSDRQQRLRSIYLFNLSDSTASGIGILEDMTYQARFSNPWKASGPFYSQDGQPLSESDLQLPCPSDLMAAYKSENGDKLALNMFVQAIWVSLA
jgi:hypothetical protein